MSNRSAADWRAKLMEQLKEAGFFRSEAVETAFRTVPRENFLPADVPLEKSYSDDAIVVKWNDVKQATSSSSQPSLMIDMLEVLQLEPGMRVLEIGAGVGYNAALMAHIIGDGKLITTVDIDPEMADIALANLQRLGAPYSDVTVLARDGFLGYAEHRPYDRIIVTVQQWEISPYWVEQLRVGGLIELPLSLSARVRSGLIPVLRKDSDNVLRAVAASTGFFMPMRGSIAHPLIGLVPSNPSTLQMVKTPLPVEKVLTPEMLTQLKKRLDANNNNATLAEAAFYFEASELSPQALTMFENQPPLPLTANGNFERSLSDYAPSLAWVNMSPEQRHAFQLVFGFKLLLATLLGDQLATLSLGLPAETSDDNSSLQFGDEWVIIGDERRYQPFCTIYTELLADNKALDMALLVNSPSAQGWRLGTAPTSTNSALEKIADAWDKWLAMGQPRSSDYRPLAYPSDQSPPAPGVVVIRQHYNFLLPQSLQA